MDPQTLVKKHMDAARHHQTLGEWLLLLGMLIFAWMLFSGAFQIYRKGLKVSASRTMTGLPAQIVAGVTCLIAIAIAVWAVILFRPGLLF